MKHARDILLQSKIFEDSPSARQQLFGTDTNGIRKLWKDASSREVMARLTPTQREGLKKGYRIFIIFLIISRLTPAQLEGLKKGRESMKKLIAQGIKPRALFLKKVKIYIIFFLLFLLVSKWKT